MGTNILQWAGKPYRPSSGCEGIDFQNRWCCGCASYGPNLELPSCEVLRNSFADTEYPTEWVYSESGKPTCTAFRPKCPVCNAAFELLGDGVRVSGAPWRCNHGG